jgi:RNA 2',3'-cyclic 3'-phosphodiesterase
VRTFLAVNFSNELRAAIWRAVAPLREGAFPVKWVQPELIHLTVKFLGDVAPDAGDAIISSLQQATAGIKAFELPMGGLGAFPNPDRPRVVWIGCEPVPALEILQDRVEREMERLGYPLEGRPFRPHVTIGRVRRDVRAEWRGFAGALEAIDFESGSYVASVDIMHSALRRSGPEYSVAAHVALEA